MKKLNNILGFTALLMCTVAFSQQQSQYSMYMMNNYTLNPAVGGTENYTDLKASFRKQWLGFNGTPTNFYVSGHTAIGKVTYDDPEIQSMPYHGVGGYIYRDQEGPNSKIGVYGSYAYHKPLTTKLTLSLGAFVGVQNLAIDASKLSFHDDKLGVTDATSTGDLSRLLPDATLGGWLYHKNYYIGASFFQIFRNNLKMGDVQNGGVVDGKLNNHYFATAGYRVPLNDQFTLVPSVVLKAVAPSPLQFDLNAKLKYLELAWGGISYRNKDAIILLAGVTLKEHWDIGYSYDITSSDIKQYSSGSHEILIGYRLTKNTSVKPTSQFW